MKDKYKTPASILKRQVVSEAIKAVAPKCKGNFEIPMSAINYIENGNRLRKKPIRASYSYVQELTYEMLDKKII